MILKMSIFEQQGFSFPSLSSQSFCYSGFHVKFFPLKFLLSFELSKVLWTSAFYYSLNCPKFYGPLLSRTPNMAACFDDILIQDSKEKKVQEKTTDLLICFSISGNGVKENKNMAFILPMSPS